MTSDPEASIDRLRDRIGKSDEISDSDAIALLDFSDRLFLLSSEYSDHRHEFHLMRLVNIAESVGGLAEALDEREAAEEIVRWIHRNYDNPETNKDYRTALRMFGEHTTTEDGKPESIEWVPAGYHNTYDPAPEPSEMLRWEEDVKPMIESCHNHRDRALIALAFDAGPRSGELQDLTIGDVTDHKYGLQVTVDGKQGRRTVTLIPSVPYVRQWLQVHPADGDSDAPLWSKLNEPESVSAAMIRKALQTAADRADVDRPNTPTNFRKSSASYYASKGVSQALLEERYGWQRGSEIASRYVAVFGDATDREIARVHGIDVEDEQSDTLAPQNCPRCGRENPPNDELCGLCGQVLEPGAVQSLREQEDEVRMTALRLVQENPDIAQDLQQAQDLMRLFEANPDLFTEVQDFADALSSGGH